MQQLESKLGHGDGSTPAGSSKKPLQSVRMILMGPPGAGTSQTPEKLLRARAYVSCRQGNASTKDPGQVLCLPFGRPSQQCHVPYPAAGAYDLF